MFILNSDTNIIHLTFLCIALFNRIFQTMERSVVSFSVHYLFFLSLLEKDGENVLEQNGENVAVVAVTHTSPEN